MATFRRRLLWIHGTILTLVASGNAAATTMGRMIGIGPFGFMQQNPMVWIGLIQAYLLMTIIAVLLIIGAGYANTKKWHVVGALAHSPPLIAAFLHWMYSHRWECSELCGYRLRSIWSFSLWKRSRRFILTIDKV
jgi:hypothetical protein